MFLRLIITGLAGAMTISHIVGSGSFAETASRVVASERLYRVALSSELIETLSALLLAFALYVTLKPVNKLLAQMAMYWRFGEAFIGCVAMIFSFVRLRLYMSTQPFGPLGTDQAQALVEFTRQVAGAAGNIDVICFGIGSTLFFYLFFKSACIPRILSALGIFASVVWTIMYFGKLVFPGHISTMQNVCYALMAIAEVTTGFWLMLFVVKTQGRRDRPSSRPAVSGVLDDGVGGK